MTIIDKGCWERGCACHDDRVDKDGVDVEAEMLKAVLAEREACWNILFDYAGRADLSDSDESLLAHLGELIKARGEK